MLARTVTERKTYIGDGKRYIASSRCRQLLRLLCVAGVLARHRFPVSSNDLLHLVNDESGERWCERTIQRDLTVLELIDFSEKTADGLWLQRSEHPLTESGRVLQRLCEISVVAESAQTISSEGSA